MAKSPYTYMGSSPALVPKKKKEAVPVTSPYYYTGSIAPIVPTAPAPPKVTPPSGGGGGGGGGAGGGGGGLPTPPTLDFNTELQSDFMYEPTMKAYQDAIQGARNSLRDQIQQAVIRSGYGNIASKLGGDLAQYAGDIDPTTIAAADQNQLSDRANLQRQLDRGMQSLAWNLAARGTGRSGAYAAGSGALNEGYQIASDQQMRDLLDAIGSGARDYGTLATAAFKDRQNALSAIAERLANKPGPVYDRNDPFGTGIEAATPPIVGGLPPGVNFGGVYGSTPEEAALLAQYAKNALTPAQEAERLRRSRMGR